MQEVTPYNKIIYKGREDNSNADLVNSYRHRSNSRPKYQRWSPDVNREEALKKKLARENEYIRRLEDEDKPVLMIQQKKVYKNLKDPNFISPETNEFFKVSDKSQVIDDVETHLNAAKKDDPRRPTQVMLSKAPADQDIYSKGVYKIEGLEYLPEGFLELDPILLMDDYEFETYLDKQRFTEEQRKAKVLRRKQYEDRDKARNRKVTIFVVNEYRDRLMEYFEEWYAQNRRKMTKEELEYIANILQSDYKTIAKLQDLFLRRKKVINTNHLLKYEVRNRKVNAVGSEEVPGDLKKLFLTGPTDHYIKTDPKLASLNQSYNPTYIKKYQEKYGRRPKNTQVLSKSQTKNKSARGKPMDSGAEDLSKFTKDFEVLLGSSAKPASFQATNSLATTGLNKTDASIFKNNADEDLRVYFDEEINQILDKIRACKGNGPNADGQQPPANQSYIDLHKQRLQNLISQLNDEENKEKKGVAKPEVDVAEPIFGEESRKISETKVAAEPEAKKSGRLDSAAVQNDLRTSIQKKKTTLDHIRMESMLMKYNLNPDEFRPKADTSMNQNWMMYDIRPPNLSIGNLDALAGPTRKSIIQNHRVSGVSANEDQTVVYPISEFGAIAEEEEGENEPRRSTKSMPKSPSQSEQIREKVTTVVQAGDVPQLKPSRITVISKNKKKFDDITDKFRPHLGKTEYFYDVVSPALPVNGKKQAVLMTLNVNQELILIDEVSEDTVDKLYKDFMVGVYDKDTFLVVLRNREQEVVEVFKMSFKDELTEDQIKHMLSLVADKPVRKTTVMEEFIVPGEAVRKVSSISRSKSPSRGKAKSVLEAKMSAKASQAKRLSTKPFDPSQLDEMEQQIDKINQDPEDLANLNGNKKSVMTKDLIRISDGRASANNMAPDLEAARAGKSQQEIEDEEFDPNGAERPPGKSVGTGSFSGGRPSEAQTPKMSVISSNQLVKKSTSAEQVEPSTLIRNDGPNETRMTFQDSGENVEEKTSTPKRSSFVELRNNLVEKSNQLARQSKMEGRASNVTPGQIEEEEGGDVDDQTKKGSNRHEEAFNDLLKQYNEERKSGIRPSQADAPKISEGEANAIRNSIQKMLDGARGSAQGGLMEKFEEELRKTQNDGTLIEQFYQFCREKLPTDQKYKESVLFVSLFYYFLEKKQMINQ